MDSPRTIKGPEEKKVESEKEDNNEKAGIEGQSETQ